MDCFPSIKVGTWNSHEMKCPAVLKLTNSAADLMAPIFAPTRSLVTFTPNSTVFPTCSCRSWEIQKENEHFSYFSYFSKEVADLICQERLDEINLGPQKSQETMQSRGSQVDQISCSWVLLLLSCFSGSGVFFVLRNDHQIRWMLTRLMVSSHLISSYRNLLLLLLSNSRKCAYKQDIQQQQSYLEMRKCQYKYVGIVNKFKLLRALMTSNPSAIFMSIMFTYL